jgi:DSF synthase
MHINNFKGNTSIPNNFYEMVNAVFSSNAAKSRHVLTRDYQQLKTYFDPSYQVLWCVMQTKPAPVFTPALLKDIRAIQDTIAELKYAHPEQSPKYIIWQSANEQVFSLGLDLGHISKLIKERNGIALDNYIQSCIDVFYINLMKLDIYPLVTISLIRGKAYGGGLEAALSSDIIFAEQGAKCCFPEINYNLLPALGTLNILMKKLSSADIKRLIFEGEHISPATLAEMGLIDTVVEKGTGQMTIVNYIKKIDAKHRAFASLYKTKLQNTCINYDDLIKAKQDWLDVVMHLQANDLRRLERLAKAQMSMIK